MGDILFCAFYLLLFSFIIWKAPLFNLPGLGKVYSLGAFFLKLVFGIVLWYIYAYHYKNRYSSDIFKYYDDARLMFNVRHTSMSDFFKMLTGIDDNTTQIQAYYHSMVSWINEHYSNLYSNSHFLIRFNALLMLLSWGHYGVHVIVFCFISLAGLSYIYKTFYSYLSDSPRLLFAALFLFPSVLLWSSGILKEGMVLFAMGLTLYYFKRLVADSHKLISLLFFIVGAAILFELKAYVLLCLLPGIVAEIVIHINGAARRHPLVTYVAVIILYIGAGLSLKYVSAKADPLKMLSDKQVDFLRTARGGIFLVPLNDTSVMAHIEVADSVNIVPVNPYADSLLHHSGIQYLTTSSFCYKEIKNNHYAPFRLAQGLHYELKRTWHHWDTLYLTANDSNVYRLDTYIEPAKSRLDPPVFNPTLKGLIRYIPTALMISMIRPYPNEIHSATVLIYFIENCFVLLLIMVVAAFLKRNNPNGHVALFCFSYCLLMLVLIGISTPLYGGIERYKSVVIPFMLILLLLVHDKEKFKRTLKK